VLSIQFLKQIQMQQLCCKRIQFHILSVMVTIMRLSLYSNTQRKVELTVKEAPVLQSIVINLLSDSCVMNWSNFNNFSHLYNYEGYPESKDTKAIKFF
jgi:hypothetical protein